MTFILYCLIIVTSLVAIFCLFIPTNKTSYFRWIKYYCWLNAIVEISLCVLAEYKITNMPISYFSIWMEVYLLLQFFFITSPPNSKNTELKLYLGIYLGFASILLFLENIFKFNQYTQIFEGIIISTFCILYLRDELKSPKFKNILAEPTFWFVSAFLIYYGCTWLIVLSTEIFIIDKNMFIYIWDYQNILGIIKNIVITVGILCLR